MGRTIAVPGRSVLPTPWIGLIHMPTPARPSVEEQLESLLDKLEGALDRTEQKIANNTLGGYQDTNTTESKDNPHG